jgi:hypothetical protein
LWQPRLGVTALLGEERQRLRQTERRLVDCVSQIPGRVPAL